MNRGFIKLKNIVINLKNIIYISHIDNKYNIYFKAEEFNIFGSTQNNLII